jgi:uncharacterized protein YndB with AHSA1/START domain
MRQVTPPIHCDTLVRPSPLESRMKSVIPCCVLALVLSSTALAEVNQSGPDHFQIGFSADVAATPARTYAALGQVQHWWSSEHTWSGDAANLSLKTEAGGCFCERWKQGSSEHGRVIMAVADELLRLQAALGPLQESALNGVLSFQLAAGADGTTQLNIDYRVNGAGASGLDQFAPAVDRVLAQQIDRLLRYIDTGNPEPPAIPAVEPSPSKRAARAALIEEWAQQAAAAKAAKHKPKKTPHPARPPARD